MSPVPAAAGAFSPIDLDVSFRIEYHPAALNFCVETRLMNVEILLGFDNPQYNICLPLHRNSNE
jgi:hypothetical protein